MDNNANPKILIAGAGPSGLILALALRRNGVPVRVIDKLATPALGQRGPAISPRTQEILRTLGVLDDVKKWAISPPPIRTYAGTEPLKTFSMTAALEATPVFPFREPIWIGQNRLEGVLRDALHKYSCEVEFGTTLVSLVRDMNGVDATIVKEDGKEETQRFEFLVGADGARGVVRKQLGLTFLGESRPGNNAIIGDIRVEGLGQDYWHMWGELASQCVFLRPTGEPNLFGLISSFSGLDCDAVMKDRAAFQDALDTVTGRKDLKVLELVWLAPWRPNIRMVNKFSAGRCFVAGDAGHVHSPTGGQGLNSGAQDSFNLAWKLALVINGQAPISLLDSYDEERTPVIKEMLRTTTDLLNRNANSDDDSRWDRGGPLLMLGVNYRWSTIVLDEQNEVPTDKTPNDAYGVELRGLKAGDRAPDAPELKDVRGGQTAAHLFDVFDPSRHTVLALSPSPERAAALVAQLSRYPQGVVRFTVIIRNGAEIGPGVDMVLEDTAGHAHTNYAFEGGCEIAVVRPDGVIGAVVRGPEGVGRYFSKIFNV
ncbi:FAD binding domain-containing protein [Mycena albidolilacea]|uniref:FAD binding domain-containing protein n=1 Tax=Mycena albidolilacea TaxID=1033008 RepID=A0AAD6ZAJ6_9AGAR|nr:FAD binding domain-containing protein [Mycena albidolilacea]